jgi:hypothetical protein
MLKTHKKEKSLPLPKGSNTAARRVAKLKRAHPAIAERLAAGEFKSVAAAERATRSKDYPPLRAGGSAMNRKNCLPSGVVLLATAPWADITPPNDGVVVRPQECKSW